MLGAGERLFPAEGPGLPPLRVLEDRVFSNGVRATVFGVVREG